MQIALSDEIFLLDLLNFFRTCDPETVQQRLATRLFDDDHVTLLCKLLFRNIDKLKSKIILGYGFRTDAAMLIASFPIFDRALFSGKTLLDLSLVQSDVGHQNKYFIISINLPLSVVKRKS